MLMLQITSAQGPEECQIAVKHALRRLCNNAESMGLHVSLLEEYPTRNGYLSVVVGLLGDATLLRCFREQWEGTLLWRCSSPIRTGYLRKNWFIAIQALEDVDPELVLCENDIVYTTCRSSGKGGQHVNKTDTAVHAHHQPTGLHVKVQTERSQHQNKAIARRLLASKLRQQHALGISNQRTQKRALHWEVERGNPVQSFHGPTFDPL